MSKIKNLFLLIACFALTNTAFAWDDAGHKLTGYIAWQQMTPQARAAAIKILRSAPEDSHLSVFYMQDSRSEAARQLELFMIATTWADIVRNREFKNRYEKYHKSNWHYADTFWRQENGKPVILPHPEGVEGGKAVEKLFEFEKVLKDAAASDEDKAIALAWVLHLGGDIHQPLHTSARITDLEPKGDQGGNLFLLTPQETPRNQQVNLHWFWDSIVMRNVPRENDLCDSNYLVPIAQQMMEKHPFSTMQNRLKLGQFDEWQQDSFKIAINELFPATLIRFQTPTDAYKNRAYQISQEQIALAGYRMGTMLNQIFGEDKTRREIEQTGSKIGQGSNDTWLWFKTRAALLKTDELRDSSINIDVINEVVTLKGKVANAAQKMKAEQVAKNIEGVKQIINQLQISK
jgi:osmotically-inducible protein OsmY